MFRILDSYEKGGYASEEDIGKGLHIIVQLIIIPINKTNSLINYSPVAYMETLGYFKQQINDLSTPQLPNDLLLSHQFITNTGIFMLYHIHKDFKKILFKVVLILHVHEAFWVWRLVVGFAELHDVDLAFKFV